MATVGEAPARRSPGRPARAVYVWEWPVRIVHWVIVATLVVLSATGYYLHSTFLPGTGAAGRPGFLMAQTRAIHEIAGFVFLAAVLVRVYWAFAGNRFAHWRALLPITRGQLRDLREMVRYYALIRRRPPVVLGHNPLAGIFYVGIYVLFFLAGLSGLGLYAWTSRIPGWATLFGWTYRVMPIEQLRLLNYLLMYVFVAFTIHHVYSAILIDVEERNGELSSIVTGYKAERLCASGDEPRQGGS